MRLPVHKRFQCKKCFSSLPWYMENNWGFCQSSCKFPVQELKFTWICVYIDYNFTKKVNFLWSISEALYWPRTSLQQNSDYGFFYPASFDLLKVSKGDTETRSEISLEIAIKTLEQRRWCRSGVLIGEIGRVSHILLLFLFLIMEKW